MKDHVYIIQEKLNIIHVEAVEEMNIIHVVMNVLNVQKDVNYLFIKLKKIIIIIIR